MNFTESNLLDGEKLVYRAKLHWYIFIKPVLFLVFVILFDINADRALGGLPFAYMSNMYTEVIKPVRIVLWVSSIIYLIYAIIDYITTEIYVTTKRITRKRGIISRKTLDIKLNMVEAVILNQGIIGRLFNYGHVYITGVGSIITKFHGIYESPELRNAIIKQIIPGSAAVKKPGPSADF